MKRCSKSVIIREMQISATVKYYLTPTRVTAIKTTKKNTVKLKKKTQTRKITSVGKNSRALLLEMLAGTAAIENSVAIPQKVAQRIIT